MGSCSALVRARQPMHGVIPVSTAPGLAVTGPWGISLALERVEFNQVGGGAVLGVLRVQKWALACFVC